MAKDLVKQSSFYAFANNAISCFFFFCLIIDLYLLILAVIAQIFNPIIELIIPTEISTKEAKAEMEIHILTAKTKVRSVQCDLESYKPFCSYYSSINSFWSISLTK